MTTDAMTGSATGAGPVATPGTTATPPTAAGSTAKPQAAIDADERDAVRVVLIPRNIWRVGFAVLAVLAVGLFGRFVLADGGSVIFSVLMAWFEAIAIAPAVDRPTDPPGGRRESRGQRLIHH